MSLFRLWTIIRKEFRHVQRDRRLLAPVLPPGFAAALETGKTAEVQLLADGTDAINSSIFVAVLSARIGAWAEPYQPVEIKMPVETRALV